MLSTPRRRFLTTRPPSSELSPDQTKYLAEICTLLSPAQELSFSDSRVSRRKNSLRAPVEAEVAEVVAVATDPPVVVLPEVPPANRDNPQVVVEPERAAALSRTRMNSPAFERVSSH